MQWENGILYFDDNLYTEIISQLPDIYFALNKP